MIIAIEIALSIKKNLSNLTLGVPQFVTFYPELGSTLGQYILVSINILI